jgi:PAS domain S-box-containing protein
MMKDEDKTKEHLIHELVEMRQQVAELEAADSERKRAEEELKELLEKIERAKQEWESTADSLPELVCLVDDQGRIIRANRTVETWNLARVVDVKGRGVHELLHPDCADSSCYLDSFWKKAWEEAIRGQPAQCEAYDEVLKCHVLVRVEPWKDWGKGTAFGSTVVVVRDITERKRAEEKIKRLAKFPSENPNPVLRVAKDGTILYANKASLPLLSSWRCQINQPLPDYWHEFILNVLSSGSSKDTEVECEGRILSLTFAPVVDADYVNLYGLDITARKRAEEELRESTERFHSLFDGVPVGLYRTTPEGQIVDVNTALVQILGYPDRESLLALNVPDGYMDPEERRRWQALMEHEGAVHGFEVQWRRGDGTAIWVKEDARAVRDYEGQALCYDGAVEDITERKQAEEALWKSNRQLESRERFIAGIVESIPSSLLVIDQRLRVVSVNRNFLEKSRREEQATLGRKIEEVFPQPLVEYTQLNQKVQEVFRTGEPLEGGKVAYRAPGLPTRIYYYRLIPLYLSPDGEREKAEEAVENVMLLMDDITEQEKLGEEVRRAERHLASVVDSAYDLVVSMDPQGRILTWNRTAERTSGLELEEVKGQYLPDLCVEEEQQEMTLWLAQWAQGQFTKKSIEINLRTKTGKEVPISWTGSRMLDDEHRIVGLVAVGRDLTERKRLEAQLIQSAKLTSLGVMAGGIAHEIRNPLAISSAAAQLLLDRPDDEQLRKEAVEKIYSGVQRTSYIIENLLKFARPPEERMVPTDITEALEETLSLLANQLRVQRVKLRKDLAPDLPPVVGNKPLLQQVFSNMILNACNAMPDGGRLTVVTRATETGVEIQFADTGVGISTEHLSKIFDPFFTTMPVGKGVGLGLSISYSIIQQHQGTIDVVSQVGQGTIFTIRLPVGSG